MNVIDQQIDAFFEGLFPDQELRSWMLKVLADIYINHNIDENIYIWVGAGGNGKTTLAQLMKLAFDDAPKPESALHIIMNSVPSIKVIPFVGRFGGQDRISNETLASWVPRLRERLRSVAANIEHDGLGPDPEALIRA